MPLEPCAQASWDEALHRVANTFGMRRRSMEMTRGGVFGGRLLTSEKSCLLGKFARVALQTANIDHNHNGRICLSAAAAVSIRSFGIDRGLLFPTADIGRTEVVFLVGAYSAETMPPLLQHFEQQRSDGGKLVVADLRLTAVAQRAGLHLRLPPGAAAALANRPAPQRLRLLTGQSKGQGGREYGQKADRLPGYRRIDAPAARRHVAAVRRINGTILPGPGKSAYELRDSLGRTDSDASKGVRAVLVMGSNVIVSAPQLNNVVARLRSLDFLAVSDFFRSGTTAVADVVLPSAQWAEEAAL